MYLLQKQNNKKKHFKHQIKIYMIGFGFPYPVDYGIKAGLLFFLHLTLVVNNKRKSAVYSQYFIRHTYLHTSKKNPDITFQSSKRSRWCEADKDRLTSKDSFRLRFSADVVCHTNSISDSSWRFSFIKSSSSFCFLCNRLSTSVTFFSFSSLFKRNSDSFFLSLK